MIEGEMPTRSFGLTPSAAGCDQGRADGLNIVADPSRNSFHEATIATTLKV